METALTIRDRKILELFASGLSPQEVEEKMGVPAAHALVRCKEILASRDVFDEIEQKQLSVQRANALYAKAQAYMDQGWVKDFPKHVEAMTKLLKEIRETRNADKTRSMAEIKAMAQGQAVVFGEIIKLSFSRVLDHIADKYPDVDIDDLNDVFEKGTREIAASYSS